MDYHVVLGYLFELITKINMIEGKEMFSYSQPFEA